MPTPRRTITRDSVFRTTAAPQVPAQGVTPQETPARQTAVWLADEEMNWLDDQCQEVRRGGWRSVTRSALIRALFRAGMDTAPDLSGVSAERELTQRLLSHR
jgi:hypothetical protein